MSEVGEVPEEIAEEASSHVAEQQEEWRNVSELPFDELQRGSRFRVYYAQNPDDLRQKRYYDIEVTGKRKDGLRALITPDIPMSTSRHEPDIERFIGTIPGSLKGVHDNVSPDEMHKYDTGLIPGVIKVATPDDANRFTIQKLSDFEGHRLTSLGSSINTAPIRRISVKTT